MELEKKSSKRKERAIGYAIISPALFIILFVMLIPLLCGIVLSMFDYSIGQTLSAGNFVGLSNYIKIFSDKVFFKSLWVTIRFCGIALMSELILGIFIAQMIIQVSKKMGTFFRAICSMPLFISPVIVGLIWKYLYDPTYGVVHQGLKAMGLNSGFGGLGSTSWALFCVIIADVWQTVPFVLLVSTSGISAISPDLYEAGRIDGAGNFKMFFSITLPLMKKVIAVICLIRGVDAFRVFDIISALTGGGPNNSTLSLSMYSFQKGFTNYQFGYAMAISVVTMLILFAVFGPMLKRSVNNN